ncbi:MAG: alanine dehydrogenase, partial [Nannocystaceae bacterium]
NMPGAVPQTSTTALTNATLPWAMALATEGVAGAARGSVHLARGLNTFKGVCVCAPVAAAHGLDYTPLSDLL